MYSEMNGHYPQYRTGWRQACDEEHLWVSADRKVRPIKDLTTDHLRAIIRCMKRKAALFGQGWKRPFIAAEIRKRYVP
jgi:hypothetical protein